MALGQFSEARQDSFWSIGYIDHQRIATMEMNNRRSVQTYMDKVINKTDARYTLQ
jgi:hypothetical protein